MTRRRRKNGRSGTASWRLTRRSTGTCVCRRLINLPMAKLDGGLRLVVGARARALPPSLTPRWRIHTGAAVTVQEQAAVRRTGAVPEPARLCVGRTLRCCYPQAGVCWGLREGGGEEGERLVDAGRSWSCTQLVCTPQVRS